ncbi:MAG: amidohydrolase [Acidobacteriota bacterium]
MRCPGPRCFPLLVLFTGLLMAACAGGARRGLPSGARDAGAHPPPEGSAAGEGPFPSTYRPLPSAPLLIHDATILTGTGERIDHGDLVLRDGRVAAVGKNLARPEGGTMVDAGGRWVTPGIIDVHSHLGVYPSPRSQAVSDGNEATAPVTAQVWAEHSIWPQDPQFTRALAGGVTSMMILPGSANLIGGRGVTVKNVRARTMQAMKFPGAPYGLKMACGENPKRVYGGKGQAPSTRMGNVAGDRAAWIQAEEYRRKWRQYRKKEAAGEEVDPPQRDLNLDTLAGVLDGAIRVQNHCYRADEMAVMIDLAREFGYSIAAFHHAVEAYKIADLLAENGICAAMWADWWGFKLEAEDGIPENVALVDAAGACAVVHSDSAEGIQRLNQEAAKAMAAGNHGGIPVSRERAIAWITLNAARVLGIDRWTGSLEPGKMGDVVLWSGDPFSVYSRTDQVFIDGALVYDREDPRFQPRTDFEIDSPRPAPPTP